MDLERITKSSFFLLTVVAALSVELLHAAAEDVYKWTDNQGKITYSSKPPSAASTPAQLPLIGREDIDEKIDKIKEDTVPNCEMHGGVDCSQGADNDGSVICLDGQRSALLPFRFACLESRLSVSYRVRVLGPENKELPLKQAKKELAASARVRSIYASVRNSSSVKAFGIRVELKRPTDPKIYLFEGPREVEGFGLADYSISLPEAVSKYQLERFQLRVRCTNCS